MVLLHVKIDATMTTLTNAVTTVLVTPIVQTVVHVTMSSANLTVQMVLAQTQLHHQTASKAITNLVKRSQLPSSSVLGLEGAINVQGEDQKKLDVITNDILKMALRHTGKVGVLASEEEDRPVSKIGFNLCFWDT